MELVWYNPVSLRKTGQMKYPENQVKKKLQEKTKYSIASKADGGEMKVP